MPSTRSINIFTIKLDEKDEDFKKYPTENQIAKYSTKKSSNVSTTSSKPITCSDASETSLTIQNDTSSVEEISSLNAVKSSSVSLRISGNSTQESTTSKNEHCSIELSSSTSDSVLQALPSSTNSICNSSIDYAVSTETPSNENSLQYCSTPEASLQSVLTENRLTENDAATQNEHCPNRIDSSSSQLSSQVLLSSSVILEQSLPFNQYESSPGLMTNKLAEVLSLSTIGPPPLYVPSFSYEPPGFYEPPPPYASFSLDSFPNLDEINQIEQALLDNESINQFRIELIRFTGVAFFIILSMYMMGLMKQT